MGPGEVHFFDVWKKDKEGSLNFICGSIKLFLGGAP